MGLPQKEGLQLPVSNPSDFDNTVERNEVVNSSIYFSASSSGAGLEECGENIPCDPSSSTSSSDSGTSPAESERKLQHLPRSLEASNQLHPPTHESSEQSCLTTEGPDLNTVGTTPLYVHSFQLQEASYHLHPVRTEGIQQPYHAVADDKSSTVNTVPLDVQFPGLWGSSSDILDQSLYGEIQESFHPVTDGHFDTVYSLLVDEYFPNISCESPSYLRDLLLTSGETEESFHPVTDVQSNTVNTVLLNVQFPRSCESLIYHLDQLVTYGETQESSHTVADGHNHSNIVDTTPQWQSHSEHTNESLYGLEELINAEDHADSDGYHQQMLDSMIRELENFIKSEPENASCSTTINEDDHMFMIVNHLLFPDIIMASVACYKIGANEKEERMLDDLAKFHISQLDPPNQKLKDKSSSLGEDPRLDLCLEKYLHLLREFKLDIEQVAASAATFCNQMKQKVLIQCPELDDSVGPKQSESGSVSVCPDEHLIPNGVEEMPLEDHAQANDSAISRQTSGQMLNDDEWRGAILATYDPTVLKNLKDKHLKEGRKNAKLPEPSRRLLMDWWNEHTGNPYPIEEEKQFLAKQTGLEIDQINNWFINQRKRHCCPVFTQNHSSHAPECYKVTAPRR